MLQWIGMEKSLLEIQEQRPYVLELAESLEGEGFAVVWTDGREIGELQSKEWQNGLLVMNLCGENKWWGRCVGKLAVTGFVDLLKEYGDIAAVVPYVLSSFDGVDSTFLKMVYSRFHHISLTIAEGKRWELREIRREDVPYLWEMGMTIRSATGSRALMTGSNLGSSTLEEEMDYVRDYIDKMYGFYQYGMWVLCQPDKQPEQTTGLKTDLQKNYIGLAGLDNIDENDLPADSILRQMMSEFFTVQAGYCVTTRYRRKGYGLEALVAVKEYAMDNLGVERVALLIEPDNIASVSLAQKAGFVRLESTLYRGGMVDVYCSRGDALRV